MKNEGVNTGEHWSSLHIHSGWHFSLFGCSSSCWSFPLTDTQLLHRTASHGRALSLRGLQLSSNSGQKMLDLSLGNSRWKGCDAAPLCQKRKSEDTSGSRHGEFEYVDSQCSRECLTGATVYIALAVRVLDHCCRLWIMRILFSLLKARESLWNHTDPETAAKQLTAL